MSVMRKTILEIDALLRGYRGKDTYRLAWQVTLDDFMEIKRELAQYNYEHNINWEALEGLYLLGVRIFPSYVPSVTVSVKIS